MTGSWRATIHRLSGKRVFPFGKIHRSARKPRLHWAAFVLPVATADRWTAPPVERKDRAIERQNVRLYEAFVVESFWFWFLLPGHAVLTLRRETGHWLKSELSLLRVD